MINKRRRIWTPDRPNPQIRTKTAWFQPSNDTIREQHNLLSNMFYLVRQGAEFGERLRCTKCNNRHDYITLNCIEKPVSGLANGLYAYYRALKDSRAPDEMPPEVRERLEHIHQVLNMMPDLSTVHPQFARQFVKDIGPSDMQMGAVSLGILEGISPTEARRLADKINERGIRPKFVLGTPNQAEIDRALSYRGPQFSRSRW